MRALRKNMRSGPERGPAARTTRTNDPEATKQDIIAVATHEFAKKGLSGARIDEIAARTKNSKRMIYYYFGGKEGLYIAVLEEVYRRIRHTETHLQIDHLSPEEALRQLVHFSFDNHQANPDFVRLVMDENLHHGKYLARSKNIQKLNVPAVAALRRILERGQMEGVFRAGIDPIDLHMSISALCFHHVSNHYSFSTIFKNDMTSPKALRARKAAIAEMILAWVRRPGAP